MKKIGQSKIVNLAIAFVIAILLSSYVLSTRSTKSSSNGSNNFSTIIPEKKATLKVALNVQFDNDKYDYLDAYKDWEKQGFTDKALEWHSIGKYDQRPEVTIKELFD